MAFNIVN